MSSNIVGDRKIRRGDAFRQEMARLSMNRLPYALAGLAASFTFAWYFENKVHPERFYLYAVLFSLEMGAWLLAWIVPQIVRLSPRAQIGGVLAASIAVEVMMCLYHIISWGEGEILGLA